VVRRHRGQRCGRHPRHGNRDDQIDVVRRSRAVGERVDIDRVGGASPGLGLLRYFLGVGRGEHAGGAGISERSGTDSRRLDTASRIDRQGRAHEGRVDGSGLKHQRGNFGARDVRINPLNIGQLFDGKFTDGSFFTLVGPF
jgi:hypothetical protein